MFATALQLMKLVSTVQKMDTMRTRGIQLVMLEVIGSSRLAIHAGIPVFSAVSEGATTNMPITSSAAPQGISFMHFVKSSRRSPFSSFTMNMTAMPTIAGVLMVRADTKAEASGQKPLVMSGKSMARTTKQNIITLLRSPTLSLRLIFAARCSGS